MKCERCGQNEATYFVRSNVNGRVTQSHLCPACARATGVAGRTSLWDGDFFTRPFSLLEPFFGAMGQGLLGEFPAPRRARHPRPAPAKRPFAHRRRAGKAAKPVPPQRPGSPAPRRR